MIDVPFIGLTGPADAGKDTVFDRMRELGGDRFVRFSVADPLKESIAALLGVSLAHLERMKRDPQASIVLSARVNEQGVTKRLGEPLYRVTDLSMRRFMQRYGTEAHRGVFGEDFWLNHWETEAAWMRWHHDRDDVVIVNTSVRFENEARKIRDLGGQVWHVEGRPDANAAGHESENRLPDELIDHVIDNTERDWYDSGEPRFDLLDDQIATLIHGGNK